MFYVLNHYSRDPGFVIDQIEAQNFGVNVHTDYTDYGRRRDNTRYKGLIENYVSCLADSPDLDWRIIFHDDVVIPPGALNKMLHILEKAPKTGISFYNPSNNGYRNAVKQGHHVMRTYGNYWVQAFAWPKEYTDQFLNWVFLNAQPYGPRSEDSLIWAWSAATKNPMHSIIPSLTQHEGYDRSTFGNPPKSGKNWRYSETFNSDFNVRDVNWDLQFANPYIDKMVRKGL